MKIITSSNDDWLYTYLIELLDQVKLVQGASSLLATLRRHRKIKAYLIQKQADRINSIESEFFDDSGLKSDAIESHEKSCNNPRNVVY